MLSSIHNRQKILIPHRELLTNQLTKNDSFQNELSKLYRISSRFFYPDLTSIQNEIHHNSNLFIGRDLTSFEIDQINKIISVVLHLSEEMTPFYKQYVQWVYEYIKDTIHKDSSLQILFSGRDSYPFFLAALQHSELKKFKENIHHVLFNRGNIIHLYKRCYDKKLADLERKNVINYYKKHDLVSKNIIVCDFGFFGTLERTHKIILNKLNDDLKINLLGHFLVVKANRNPKDISVFDKAIDRRSFLSKDRSRLQREDEIYHSKIKGFLNENTIPSLCYLADHNTYLNSEDKPFIYWLQEIGSGIVESRYLSLQNESQDYLKSTEVKLASLQQITAYLAFVKGLKINLNLNLTLTKTTDLSSLEKVYKIYKKNKIFWQELIAYEDRASVSLSMEYESLLNKINNQLKVNNFQTTSIPYDA